MIKIKIKIVYIKKGPVLKTIIHFKNEKNELNFTSFGGTVLRERSGGTGVLMV